MLNACYFALPLFLCLPPAAAATLSVQVDGAQAGGGPVTVLLFDRADGFPTEARAFQRHALAPGQTTLLLEGLAPGRYAVMAYHDADGNGELNRLFGMIPQEGWGLSNNPAVRGKPAFKDAAVEVPEAGAAVTVKLNY